MAGFYVGHPAFAAMKRQGYGRILLTSSASGVFVTPMALWLVSEAGKTTHSLYSATAGRFARAFIAEIEDAVIATCRPPGRKARARWRRQIRCWPYRSTGR
jgi:hypothetical protein